MSDIAFSLDPDDDNSIIISSPFAAKDVIRSLPKRRWDGDIRCWVIPYYLEDHAKAVLMDAGFSVRGLTHAEKRLRRSQDKIATLEDQVSRLTIDLRNARAGQPRHSNVRPSGNTFNDLAAFLPNELRGPVYRALIRVLHPDAGGTTSLAQQLNDSRLRAS